MTTLASSQTAAISGAVLIAAVVVFQVALALGAPLGDAVLGGAAPTHEGVLTGPFRALAAVQAVVLVLMAWVVLARADVLGMPVLGGGALVWTTWGLVVFLALNTAANVAATHPVERWGMGLTTAALTGITLYIAVHAPVPGEQTSPLSGVGAASANEHEGDEIGADLRDPAGVPGPRRTTPSACGTPRPG